MFGKISVLIAAALALAACETQSGAVMTPPLSKTGTPNPEQAPVSYMVFFNLGSTKLSDQDQNTVAQAAQVYKTRPNARVMVTGYADTVGSPSANMALSQQRANVVKNLLVQSGVPAGAITTAASGDTGLLVETAAQTNQPKNRRVSIVIQQ
jgi:outer membrane protein OmpA-like peptidoglycan-associated protein